MPLFKGKGFGGTEFKTSFVGTKCAIHELMSWPPKKVNTHRETSFFQAVEPTTLLTLLGSLGSCIVHWSAISNREKPTTACAGAKGMAPKALVASRNARNY